LHPALKQIATSDVPAHQGFDHAVDAAFFHYLFENVERPADEASFGFVRVLRELAWQDLQRAIGLSPLRDARRYRAIAAAEGMFEVCMRKNFPDLYARTEASMEDMQ
jgi:hypothetical protein